MIAHVSVPSAVPMKERRFGCDSRLQIAISLRSSSVSLGERPPLITFATASRPSTRRQRYTIEKPPCPTISPICSVDRSSAASASSIPSVEASRRRRSAFRRFRSERRRIPHSSNFFSAFCIVGPRVALLLLAGMRCLP